MAKHKPFLKPRHISSFEPWSATKDTGGFASSEVAYTDRLARVRELALRWNYDAAMPPGSHSNVERLRQLKLCADEILKLVGDK